MICKRHGAIGVVAVPAFEKIIMNSLDQHFDQVARVARQPFPPALCLNADHLPLSYAPLSLWNWQDVAKAVTSGVALPVHHYDIELRSPSTTLRLPSVIALTRYVHQPDDVAMTRYTIFLRDRFQCLYCNSVEDLTFDHVVPRSAGGITSWLNIATCCGRHNNIKGSRTLRDSGLVLRRQPYKPRRRQLEAIARSLPLRHLHQDWRSAAYWDVELES